MSAARNAMKRYTYRGIAALGVACYQLGGIVAICFVTLITVSVTVLAVSVKPPYWDILWFIVWWPLLGWPMGLAIMCTFPTSIWLDDKGLVITVFWRKCIVIPWSDVLGVRRRRFGARYLVIARRITLWHRLVGWTYGHTLYPAFLIAQGLENREGLVREIKLRIGQLE